MPLIAEIMEWHPLRDCPKTAVYPFERVTRCTLCRRLTDSTLTPGGRCSDFRICRPCARERGGGLEMVRQADLPFAWHRVRLTEES